MGSSCFRIVFSYNGISNNRKGQRSTAKRGVVQSHPSHSRSGLDSFISAFVWLCSGKISLRSVMDDAWRFYRHKCWFESSRGLLAIDRAYRKENSMAISWLVILVLYGIFAGFGEIPLVLWFLLIPFLIQDNYDSRH